MRVYKSALLSVALILLVLAFVFSVTSSYTFSTTSYVSLPTNVTTFSLSFIALILVIFVVLQSQSPQNQYRKGQTDLDKIKEIMSDYFGKKRLKTEKLLAHVLPYIVDMIENDSNFFYHLQDPAKSIFYRLYTSSNLKSHGHFDPRQAEQYLKQLRKELRIDE